MSYKDDDKNISAYDRPEFTSGLSCSWGHPFGHRGNRDTRHDYTDFGSDPAGLFLGSSSICGL